MSKILPQMAKFRQIWSHCGLLTWPVKNIRAAFLAKNQKWKSESRAVKAMSVIASSK